VKIIIDLGHPAHVHIFRNFSYILQKNGHDILFTARDKEVTIDLLNNYNLNYINLGKHFKSKFGKILGLAKYNLKIFKIIIRFKPSILISHGSMYAAQSAWLFNKPHISLEDTGNMEQVRLYKPFTKYILTSNAFHKNLGTKQILYNGYHELAYLHPKYFTPNKNILAELGITQTDKFFIIRFVSWDATHDFKHTGLDRELTSDIIELCSSYGRIFISSESKLPSNLQPYQLKINPIKIHDLLYYSTIFIGEGATMASECAMLGTPAIYINSITAGSLEEQEKYGLLFGFRNRKGVLEKIEELLKMPNLKDEFRLRRDMMLRDKIDVTAFIVWFIENYPESARIMKKNPDYQLRFK
jgi:predicted glycosyltransferase